MRIRTTLLAISTGLLLAPWAEAKRVADSPVLWATYPARTAGHDRPAWRGDFGVAGNHCNAPRPGTVVGGPSFIAGRQPQALRGAACRGGHGFRRMI